MRPSRLLIAIAAVGLVWASPESNAETACNEVVAFKHHLETGSATVTSLAGSALKFRSALAINTDGAPNAYHIDGRPTGALNTLCNAGRATSIAHGTYEGQENCDLFLQDVKAAQQNGWHGTPRIVWHGVVTKDATRHEPVVQASGDYKGYFVSATSLENKAFKADDQRRYLDSRIVPYVVLPRRSAFLSQGGTDLGDLAFVIDPVSQRYSFAVVGDLGPKAKLGEASIALAAAIKGAYVDPKTLTGRETRKLVVPQQVVTLIFPGATVKAPYDAGQIAEAAATVIQGFGGLDRLKRCAVQP